ncbi:MAG TPA: hypothetical protein VF120_04535 [Ktedonobacterales bacterium]
MAIDASSISAAFQQALGRQPSQQDIQYWQNYEQQHGLDVNTLIHYLMNNVRQNPQDAAALITAAYQDRLHRAPSQQEIDWWRGQIDAHQPSGSNDSELGSDEPFTFAKFVGYIQMPEAQQAAASGAPTPATAGSSGQQQQHQGGGGLFGIKFPWQK